MIFSRKTERRLPTFEFRGTTMLLFVHAHNCGWPPYRMTERAVELAIADHWLDNHSEAVIEVGAVTPYYWPGRVAEIVDPADQNKCVTRKATVDEVNLRGRNVMAISTFEHIGTSDYGLDTSADALKSAFEKLFDEAADFLVTVPTGYNAECDRFVFGSLPPTVQRTCLCRGHANNNWIEVDDPSSHDLTYGHATPRKGVSWANGLVVLTRR